MNSSRSAITLKDPFLKRFEYFSWIWLRSKRVLPIALSRKFRNGKNRDHKSKPFTDLWHAHTHYDGYWLKESNILSALLRLYQIKTTTVSLSWAEQFLISSNWLFFGCFLFFKKPSKRTHKMSSSDKSGSLCQNTFNNVS